MLLTASSSRYRSLVEYIDDYIDHTSLAARVALAGLRHLLTQEQEMVTKTKTSPAEKKSPSNEVLYGIIAQNSPELMKLARALEEASAQEDSELKTSTLLGIIASLDPELMDAAQALAGELLKFEEGRRLRHYAVAEAVIAKLPVSTQQALYTAILERDDLDSRGAAEVAAKLLTTVKVTDLNDCSTKKIHPVGMPDTLEL